MNTPITADELKEILRLHEMWLDGNPDGKRANLSEANLSEANLSEANLRWANLRWANGFILIGQDIRGYIFTANQNKDGIVVIRAGCREFVGVDAARKHWEDRHTGDDVLHADCLSLVDRCERMASVRGWQLEPITETKKELA